MVMYSLVRLHTEQDLSKTAAWILSVLEEVAGNARVHGGHELKKVAEVIKQVAAEVVGQVAAEEVARVLVVGIHLVFVEVVYLLDVEDDVGGYD